MNPIKQALEMIIAFNVILNCSEQMEILSNTAYVRCVRSTSYMIKYDDQ